MKNNGFIRRLLCVVVAFTLALGAGAFFVGCDRSKRDDAPGYKVAVKLAKANISVGETTTALVVIAGTDDQDYTLSSADESVATVDEDGTITGVKAGTTDIIATANADGTSTGKATIVVGGGTVVKPVDEAKVTIELVAGQPSRLSKVGDTTKVTAKVENVADKTFVYSVANSKADDKTEYIKVDADGTVTVLALPEGRDAWVSVIATSNADTRKSAAVTIRIEAPTVAGKVGDLTSDMIKALGDDSITVKGVIKDYHVDKNTPSDSWTNTYNTTVEMEDGKWLGSYKIDDAAEKNVMSEMYVRGTEEISIKPEQYVDYSRGHTVKKAFIDKHNEKAYETLESYNGVPVLWENQYMYNILGTLDVNKFETVADDETLYNYKSISEFDDQLLMVRIGASITPLLTGNDVFSSFALRVEDGVITEIIAQTAYVYEGDNPKEGTWYEYTTFTAEISKLGSTEVADPTPYSAPEHADVLTAALDKMKAADSYYYAATDTQTAAPSASDDDYAIDSAITSAAEDTAARDKIEGNHAASTGSRGGRGWIVKDTGVLVETVSVYTSTTDGKDKKYDYDGFRPFDGYYEEFVYSTSSQSFRGVRRVDGAVTDVLPDFDMSANIFKFESESNGKYTFTLRAVDVMADVAQSVSLYDNADSAAASTSRVFTITVSADGVVSTDYPYNIADNYFGYVKTSYSRLNATELPLLRRTTGTGDSATTTEVEIFDGYTERVIPTSFDQLKVKHYHADHSTQSPYGDITAAEAFKVSFGEAAANAIPAPKIWLWDVFGDVFSASTWEDGVSGPFFNWRDKTGGGYYDIYTFTFALEEYSPYPNDAELDGIKTKLEAVLNNAGFALDGSQTGKTSEYEGTGMRYVTFLNEAQGLVIELENNYTHNFWINIYQKGAYNRTIIK